MYVPISLKFFVADVLFVCATADDDNDNVDDSDLDVNAGDGMIIFY